MHMTRSIYSRSLPFIVKLCFWKASGKLPGASGAAVIMKTLQKQKKQTSKPKNRKTATWRIGKCKLAVISTWAEPKSMVFVSMFAKGVSRFCTKSKQMSASNNARFSRSCQEYVVQAC